MSNLNINNIDVQRIINVLNELESKITICSFLTFKTMNNYDKNRVQIQEKIYNPDFLVDLESHYEIMNRFKFNHLEIQEEVKEGERNSEIKDEENLEEIEEGANKEQEIAVKEIKDLQGIDENTSAITKELAKNTRNICRKYYKELAIVNEMKALRADSDILKFCDNFAFILEHYTKKCKMTVEEEKSDYTLNATLTAKIIDLENQIKVKQDKYEKLKKERQDFKDACNKKLKEIENEINIMRDSNKNELGQLEEKINKELNKNHEANSNRVQDLRDRLLQVQTEFDKKKVEDENEEKKAIDAYGVQENYLRNNIYEYDREMFGHKEMMENLKKEDQLLKVDMSEKKVLKDKLRDKFEMYDESYKKHSVKMEQMKYENEVKLKASEWIQANFRGFWTRKTMKKKYKFLAILKKPKIEPTDPNDKKKKGPKK